MVFGETSNKYLFCLLIESVMADERAVGRYETLTRAKNAHKIFSSSLSMTKCIPHNNTTNIFNKIKPFSNRILYTMMKRGLTSFLTLTIVCNLSFLCHALLSKSNEIHQTTNVNFQQWISDAPKEISQWKPLEDIEGTIPDYVQGTFIRNGGGIWSSSSSSSREQEMFSHIFDGLAKIHAYRINQNGVNLQARFLEGAWYKEYQKTKQLPIGIGTGPILNSSEEPKLGLWRTIKAIWNSATIFDNTPVNIWDFQPNNDNKLKSVAALTDAPPRTLIDLDSMQTLKSTTINPIAKGSKGYEMLITAHPLYSQKTSSNNETVTYNVAVELGLGNPTINLVQETNQQERSVVSSFESENGIPYLHSFGLSKNYAVVVLQPLRLDTNISKLLELGFLRGMKHVDQTRIVVIELATGKVVMDHLTKEKIYFYHSISTSEILNKDGSTTVSLRLCAYQTPDQLTGEHQFLRLEQAKRGPHWRNKLHKGGTFLDIQCNLDKRTVQLEWNDRIQQGFELPVTRYSRTHDGNVCPAAQTISSSSTFNGESQQNHSRYVYSFGAYALGASDYDSFGLFKFDLEDDKIDSYFQQDSVYLSEPAFIANPKSEREDDGVLLCEAYFGKEETTKLLVLDATTMEVVATVNTGNMAPFGFHGAWIPMPSTA